MSKTIPGPDGKPRCGWCAQTDDFFPYHDNEWGYPVDDDIRLFEKICLEGFQSGLSWRTILAKRENFRKAFKGFDFKKVAKFTEKDVERLLQDEGIIRHRGKIEATINNAQRAIEMVKQEGSIAAYFWAHEPDPADLGRATVRIDVRGIGCRFQGPQETRLEIRRADHGLFVHAGDGADQRPC